jgi:hypothetical protein
VRLEIEPTPFAGFRAGSGDIEDVSIPEFERIERGCFHEQQLTSEPEFSQLFKNTAFYCLTLPKKAPKRQQKAPKPISGEERKLFVTH